MCVCVRTCVRVNVLVTVVILNGTGWFLLKKVLFRYFLFFTHYGHGFFFFFPSWISSTPPPPTLCNGGHISSFIMQWLHFLRSLTSLHFFRFSRSWGERSRWRSSTSSSRACEWHAAVFLGFFFFSPLHLFCISQQTRLFFPDFLSTHKLHAIHKSTSRKKAQHVESTTRWFIPLDPLWCEEQEHE